MHSQPRDITDRAGSLRLARSPEDPRALHCRAWPNDFDRAWPMPTVVMNLVRPKSRYVSTSYMFTHHI